jgi:Flp pilus assembly protein TadG
MIAKRLFIDFAKARDAAIAPLYALALFGLIMIAGVGWDYSRMATMHSELQNAADQAALAAATQLTGVTGARANAEAAARDFLASDASAWVNETKLANDDGGRTVGGLSFEFFQDWIDATDEPGLDATTDANARYVRVTVGGRTARYALTAIGGLVSSGAIGASAVATLQNSVCQAPKLFVCIPSLDFPSTADKGKGLVLRQLPNATDSFSPGNFGFLDPGGVLKSDNDKGNPNRELGRNSVVDSCIASTGIESEPGFVATETNALNTRLDIYGPGIPKCNSANGDFCPAESTVSQRVYKISLNNTSAASTDCPLTPPNNANLLTLSEALDEIGVLENGNPGYQRDNCLRDGPCVSLGDGDWSGQAYMNQNHGAVDISTVSDGTRHGVYKWELGNAAARLRPRKVGYTSTTGPPAKEDLYCAYPRPVNEDPWIPPGNEKDRRTLTVAAVDCTGLNGRDVLDIRGWIDLFLVDASASTGPNSGEIMTEVIGRAKNGDGNFAFQELSRKKPVLVQ